MSSDYTFPGFDALSYTPIPDIFLDELMGHLTEAELRVALYILRRTFGFKKRSDDISLSQMVNGITTREGKVLDRGCGVQRAAVIRAVRGLEVKGVIIAKRNHSPERGNQPTTYTLRFRGEDLKDTRGGLPNEPPPVIREIEALRSEGSPQETALQETGDNRTDLSRETPYDSFVNDVTGAFGEELVAAANRSRARNLADEFSVPAEAMPNYIAAAYKKTRHRPDLDAPMAYFFSCLETILVQHHRRRSRAS